VLSAAPARSDAAPSSELVSMPGDATQQPAERAVDESVAATEANAVSTQPHDDGKFTVEFNEPGPLGFTLAADTFRVSHVHADGLAMRSNINVGDKIESVMGSPVGNLQFDDMIYAIQLARERGDCMKIEFSRGPSAGDAPSRLEVGLRDLAPATQPPSSELPTAVLNAQIMVDKMETLPSLPVSERLEPVSRDAAAIKSDTRTPSQPSQAQILAADTSLWRCCFGPSNAEVLRALAEERAAREVKLAEAIAQAKKEALDKAQANAASEALAVDLARRQELITLASRLAKLEVQIKSKAAASRGAVPSSLEELWADSRTA